VRHFLSIAIAALSLLAASTAQAQWTGKAELGVMVSSGNSEATSANTKLDLAHESDQWKHTVYVGALYGENGSFATAERYEARYQADYKINDRLSWFGAIRGEEDKFSGFAYQATVSTGAAYKFIDNPKTRFSGSLGVGYRVLKPEVLIKSPAGEVLSRIEGDQDEEPVITLGSLFEHNFNDSTKISNKLLVESGADNTAVQDDISLQVSMTDTLALAVGLGVRYNTDPPPLAETTDLLTTVNLVYNIK
jgi:putative salt-induced outer membrane protein